MAILIQEPDDKNPDIPDWQKLLYRTTIQGGGLLLVSLTNMTNTDRPMVVEGSRLEVNHSFYIATENEEIDDPPDGLVSGQVYFLYAIPHTESLSWQFLAVEPSFDTMKGGFFSGTMRAIARMLFINNAWYDKVMLSDADSIFKRNFNNVPPGSGTLIHTATVAEQTITLEAGVYDYEMQGGTGGNGGTGGTGSGSTATSGAPPPTYSGQAGVSGVSGVSGRIVNGRFILRETTTIKTKAGTSGNNGNNGSNAPTAGNSSNNGSVSGAGAGGGAGGSDAVLTIGENVIIAEGGDGGDGGYGGLGNIGGGNTLGSAVPGFGGRGGRRNNIGQRGQPGRAGDGRSGSGPALPNPGTGGTVSSTLSGYLRIRKIL